MAGNISNSNIWNQDDKKSQLEVEKMFREMVGWAVDEQADILIGQNNEAHLFLGTSTIQNERHVDFADFTFIGSGITGVGYAVSTAGDIDGDGLDDLLLAEPYYGSQS